MLNLFAAILILSSALLTAQTAPNGTGTPETVLAGIDIHHTTIASIQKMYGQQDGMYGVPPNPYPPGTKLYEWRRLTVTLKLLMEPAGSAEVIRAISVEGEGEPGRQPINQTGRGLKLGAKSSEINKQYGVDASGGSTTIKWSDGTTLVISVNEKGRVSKLELRAP